ncbi:hypothetical protein QWZ03_13180 [Chitinimonas viridis]|uniref:Uncharacterized protein n=1 Tax=Chitinimonas viridis TaxID=664880 RepID=A0ABT8B7Y5_9NEIS|nr:hypothetical protein [Chitinimonas viridis]MDN3577726.1 hypothetical protein [Chitinimonas viridis]
MSIADKERWDRFFNGFSIYDCAYGYEDRYVFLVYEKTDSPHRDPLPELRIVVARMERPMDKRFYRMQFPYFDFARVAYTSSPESEFVAVDIVGQTYGYTPPRSDEEERHPTQLKGAELGATVTQVVRIGQHAYTVGGPRRMHKRLGVSQWEDLTKDLPIPPAYANGDFTMGNYVWKSAAGFSESDIYTVGGAGDVWHYDGKHWTQCSFPSNERLYNVCCADDGKVYIGGNMGSLYVGKGNQWTKLCDSNFSVPWKDIAWFAGKLWCGSDYGLWELRGEDLIRADIPANVQLVSGAIDISPDKKWMLTAGPDGAALFDGTTWEVLFSRHDLEE